MATGEKPGFPRFDGTNRYHSCPYKESGNGAWLANGSLGLSTIGRIAVRWSRSSQGPLKPVTISKQADGWYVSCSCAPVPVEPLPLTGKMTGIDVGLPVFLITADGDIVEHPRHSRPYRQSEKPLKTANTRVSPRKQGSHRRAKAAPQGAKKPQHGRRQRADFPHQTALALVREYDVI